MACCAPPSRRSRCTAGAAADRRLTSGSGSLNLIRDYPLAPRPGARLRCLFQKSNDRSLLRFAFTFPAGEHRMRSFKTPLAVLAAAVLVAACGGGSGPGNQTSRVAFSKVVSFGDSLSDGGTYKVGT